MDRNTRDELIDAIKGKRIHPKDQGAYPGAHSEPFFYRTQNGDDFVLLRARYERFIGIFHKEQVLYPFLRSLSLPVHTPRELDIIECQGETYAVVERFFGHGYNPERFSNATSEQKERFVWQVARFFVRLHSTPLDTLPANIDYTPYFKYDNSITAGESVFLHADFNYSNFLIDDDYNLHAVFDWHPACIGPRIAEFAAFVYCNDADFLPLVLARYNELTGAYITPEQVLAHNAQR